MNRRLRAFGSGCYVIIASVILTSAGLANESLEYILYVARELDVYKKKSC
jgi:hypothetical protein